jgi:hypothetical protein
LYFFAIAEQGAKRVRPREEEMRQKRHGRTLTWLFS